MADFKGISMPGGARILVIFDLDDTLIESRRTFEPFEDAYLLGHGLSYTEEEKKQKIIGAAYNVFFKTICDDYRRIHGRDVPGDFEQGLIASYHAAIESGFELTPGAQEFLQWLREEGISYCVASNSPRRSMPRKLETSGLVEHFNFHADAGPRNAFCLDDVACGKPAPDLFFLAAREMGGFEPHECIVVEDSFPGITAGRAAGMYVIGFAGSHGRGAGEHENLVAGGAHEAVSEMTAVCAIIARRDPGFAAPSSP